MATANTKRNTNALVSDLYTTPSWAVMALIKREKFKGEIIDAGCGKGHIAKVLQSTGHNVKGVDLYDWGFGETGINYLEYSEETENVISNPPFTLLANFINKSIELATNKVAIFARVSALESLSRWESIYSTKPPTKVYMFVNRVKCNKGGHDNGESSSVFYCWMIWDLSPNTNNTNVTQLEWIDDQPTKDERPMLDINAPALHISDVRTLLDETTAMYKSCFPDDANCLHEVSVSGGKDSACSYAIANIVTEGKFNATFCDTDNEHTATIDYVENLHLNVGNNAPKVTKIKAIFTEAMFENRRKNIAKNWVKPHLITQGVRAGQTIPPMSDQQIKTAIEATVISDNAMLNTMLLHGSMPTRLARHCTEDLKINAIFNQVLLPALAEHDGEIINWSGVRAQESEKRSKYKWVSEDPRGEGFLLTFLPIHKWLVQDVFALHKYLGFKPNPLYLTGSTRVGCWPCIMSNKNEIREVATTTPEKIVQIREWEIRMKKVSRYTLWRDSKISANYDLGFLIPRKKGGGQNVHDIVKWSMTNRKGEDIEYSGADMNCKIGDHIFCE